MNESLADLQRRLQHCLLGADAGFTSAIRTTTRIPAELRLGIYAEAYRTRLLETLATDFAGLKHYLGDDAFATLGHLYIDANPSRHFSLRWFGKALPEFVANTSPYNEHVELADIAVFEWAQGLVFDAPDVPPLTITELSAVPPTQWPSLSFTLISAAQTVTLQSNAPAIWSALNEETPPPPQELLAPVTWLLWRQDLRILFRPLSMPEAIALEAFAAGNTFTDVCAQLCDHMGEDSVPGYTASLLRYWIDSGLIAAIVES